MVIFSSDNKDAFHRKSLDIKLSCIVHIARADILHMVKELLSRKSLLIGSSLTKKQIFPIGTVHMFHTNFHSLVSTFNESFWF